MALPILHILPSMVRVEAGPGEDSGYEYPEQYHGKTFVLDDKVITFDKRSYKEFPLSTYNLINSTIIEELKNYIIEIFNDYNTKLENQQNQIVELKSNLSSINDEIKAVENKLESIIKSHNEPIDISSIQAALNETLHDEIVTVKQELIDSIDEKVNNIKSNIEISANKLKFSELAMLKELGLPIEDIIQLKKNGMV